MSRPQEIISQLEALIQELKLSISSPEPIPSVLNVHTSDQLRAALAAEEPKIHILKGNYDGNFTIVGPATITSDEGVELRPIDLLNPTLTVLASDVYVDGMTIYNGAKDRECVVVGSHTATTAEEQPNNVTFMQVSVVAGPQGGHRAFSLHGRNISILECTALNFWEKGRDSQAIWINNGPGPYLIEDCYLEASGENILVGGDRTAIVGMNPSDITIRRCRLTKPLEWKDGRGTVKNSFELKTGIRVLFEENEIENCWPDGQDGTPIVVTVRNQYGDNPWAHVDDVVIRHNYVHGCESSTFAVSILGKDSNYPSEQTKRISIEENLFGDTRGGVRVINSVSESLVIRNNTMPGVRNTLLGLHGNGTTPLTFIDNVVKSGAYGIVGDGTGVGLPSLNAKTIVVDFSGNIIEKTAERKIAFPADNTLIEPGTLNGMIDDISFVYVSDPSKGWPGQ